jgi:hypothetical protein
VIQIRARVGRVSGLQSRFERLPFKAPGFAGGYLPAGRDWQVMCGLHDHDFDLNSELEASIDATAIHIAHLLERDATLKEIFLLPQDWSAKRADIAHDWEWFFDPDP